MTWSLYLPYRVMQLHFLTFACMTISGYLAAYVSINVGWSFFPVFLLGILAGSVVGGVVSLAIGDAPCFAVVIVGFTFIFITKTVIENTKALGGTLGLFGVPHIHQDPMVSKMLLLLISYVCVFFVGLFIHRLDHSPLGRAASAVFVDRDIAVSSGINVKGMGILMQTAGSAIGGAAGVLYVYLMRNVFPDFFSFQLIGTCMAMLFVGGHTTLWGTLAAAPLLWGVAFVFPDEIASWRIVLYGIVLIAVLVAKPEGLITREGIYTLADRIKKYRDNVVCK